MLRFFKRNRIKPQNADNLFSAIVRKARQPRFYSAYAVKDTVEGRYEMIVLYTSLVMSRLEKEYVNDKTFPAKEWSQVVFDRIFLDIEQALREVGVGDLSVPRHMKRMMQGFNGKARLYRDAFELASSSPNNADPILDVLKRNVYADDTGEAVPDNAEDLALYFLSVYNDLMALDIDRVLQGEWNVGAMQ